MDITTPLLNTALKAVDVYLKWLGSKYPIAEQDVSERLARHLRKIESWSSRIQVFEMSDALATDEHTIDLKINVQPRRFILMSKQTTSLSELDLLTTRYHYIVLGDPGSGKTTLSKRLCRHLLHAAPRSPEDLFAYPLVIVAREISEGGSLINAIGRELGFSSGESAEGKSGVTEEDLETVVSTFLNNTKAVLIVDGIDEIKADLRPNIDRDLQKLAEQSDNFKIIVTCRSGDYARQVEGFDLLEIAPLSEGQIVEIVERWATDPKAFLGAIHVCPYYDIINRPLFLIQLIMIYNSRGYLPERPSYVYKVIITLMLEKWDYKRGVVRTSRYATFTSE